MVVGSRSFYVSAMVYVFTRERQYGFSDTMNLAIRLSEDFGEKPYNSANWSDYKPNYSWVNIGDLDPLPDPVPRIGDYLINPSFTISTSTIVTVPHRTLRKDFKDGKILFEAEEETSRREVVD